jgi:uncharacterized protein YqgC (DUF456 family)
VLEIAGLDTLQSLTLLAMALGLVGVLIPLIPGPFLIWLAAVGYFVLRGLTWQGGIVLAVLTALMLAGSTTGLWLSSAGARRSGASGCAIAAAALAGLIGFLLFNVIGAILLPTATVLAIEFMRLHDIGQATRVGRSYLVGWLLSAGVELLLALLMVVVWTWHVGGWAAVVG